MRADTVFSGVLAMRVTAVSRGAVFARSRETVARDEVDVFCVDVVAFWRVVVTVPVALWRVAARATSDASSATAAWNASGASNTAKSSFIPFILIRGC